MSKRILTLGLPSVSLMLLLACGGGGGETTPAPTPTATSIAYSDPTSVPATSFSLKKNSASGTHLLLDLYGPTTSVTGSGVVLTLTLDTTKATWSSTPVINGSLFTTNVNGAPIVNFKLSGTTNGTLQVVVTERGVITAKPFTGPLLQLALDLKTGLAVGSTITLTPDLTKSKAVLQGTPDPSTLDLKIGTMTAQ